MSNPFNGSKLGMRGNPNRPSRVNREPKHNTTNTARWTEQAPYCEIATGLQETKEDHIVPRKSLTDQQHLRILRPEVETKPILLRQAESIPWHPPLVAVYTPDGEFIGRVLTGRMIRTTEERITWKRDQTLLRRGKPDSWGEGYGTRYKRTTSHSKRTVSLPAEVKETPQGVDILPADEINNIDLDLLPPEARAVKATNQE